MIFGKMWSALRAQMNKLANFFWTADPIAQMQYEYDTAVEELKTGPEQTVSVRVSVGLATSDDAAGASGKPTDALLTLADDALFASKHAGGNRVTCWEAEEASS